MATATARFFDAMAETYDEIEPWYAHLYAVLHAIARAALAPAPGRPGPGRALDAGCGTGFQTALLAGLGYEVHGVDVAPRLLAVAGRRLARAALAVGDVEALPYRPASFAVASSCGSTLSFVERPGTALAELARVLEPGGRLLLECEHRWSLDLVWGLVSGLTRDALGYGLTPALAWRHLTRRPGEGIVVDYPGYPSLRLFTRRELGTLLRAAGFRPVRTWGIHAVTNLLPSTLLHRPELPRWLRPIYGGLRALDRAASARAVPQRLANSVVVLAERLGR